MTPQRFRTLTIRRVRCCTCLSLLVTALTACPAAAEETGETPIFRGLSAEASAALAARLDRTIVEQGVVESSDVIEFRSDVRGETTLRFIAPDRSTVATGDLLFAFDDRQLKAARNTHQQQHAEATAAVATAEAALAAVKQRAEAGIPLAHQRLKAAQLSRAAVLGENGELALEGRRLARQIHIAQNRVDLLQQEPDSAARSNRMRALAIEEAKAELTELEEAQQLLADHIRPQAEAERELAVREAELELSLAETEAAAETRQSQAELDAARARLSVCQAELEAIETQLAACEVRAPHDGLVLHAQPRPARGQAATLTAGSVIRERQVLLTMPNLAELQVRVRVHESQIARVATGQEVTLVCDALPQQSFAGRVIDIGTTPEPTTWLNDNVVEYPVLVKPTTPPAALRIGMTTKAEIMTVATDSR